MEFEENKESEEFGEERLSAAALGFAVDASGPFSGTRRNVGECDGIDQALTGAVRTASRLGLGEPVSQRSEQYDDTQGDFLNQSGCRISMRIPVPHGFLLHGPLYEESSQDCTLPKVSGLIQHSFTTLRSRRHRSRHQ